MIISEPTAVQLSAATTPVVRFGTAPWQPLVVGMVTEGAHVVIVGAVLSVTVNVFVHVLKLPAASVTVIVTVVTPFVTTVPAAGDWVIASEPAAVQLSVAVTPLIKLGTVAEQLALVLPV